jgi:precorrin-6A/cobalt-precorrin-6A reductase
LIWIIGGTSETEQVAEKIRGKKDYIVTVATYAGSEVLNDNNVIVSRMTWEQMITFIKERKITLVLDMSHPYAIEVTNNAKLASETCGIKYVRYVRKKSKIHGAKYFDSFDECIEFLKAVDGCVFFTTGIKNISDFERIRGNNRFVYRVLPSLFSIEECIKNKLQMKDIVAILGPVSEDLNIAMFKEYNANYVVMKDSGENGGTEEKISACLKLGITPVVIGREDEEGINDLEKLLEMIT